MQKDMQNLNCCMNNFKIRGDSMAHITNKISVWLLDTATLRNLNANFIKCIYQKGPLFVSFEKCYYISTEHVIS